MGFISSGDSRILGKSECLLTSVHKQEGFLDKLDFSSDNLVTSSKRKRVSRVYYPLSPPLVSPETKFFCKKKKSVQIGRAMRIAPAEK